jgi:hypothetical protein
MHNIAKYTAMAALAGVTAVALASPSQARHGRNAAAIGGFVAGAAIGAAVANNNGYYAEGPAYYYNEPSYAYEPGPAYYSGPTYYNYHSSRDSYGRRSGSCDPSLGNQRC